MYESNSFFNPCYHQQAGMTYPHDQELCDHVPDIEGTPYGGENSYAPEYCTQNYSNNYYEKNAQDYNGQSHNQQCFSSVYEPQGMPVPAPVCFEEDRDPVKRIFDEISAECEHLLLKKNCEECRMKPIEDVHCSSGGFEEVENSFNFNNNNNISSNTSEIYVVDEETTQLALSMKRKREQNKMAAARYRENRKNKFKTTKAEIQMLEKRNYELKKMVNDNQKEINELRKKLGLPLQ